MSNKQTVFPLRTWYTVADDALGTMRQEEQMDQLIDRTESLRAHLTLSATAKLIGVATTTLSRRADCQPQARGARDLVLSPAEVMRFAAIYRKRSLNEVAAELISRAAALSAEDGERVEAAVEAFFAGQSQKESAAEFLAQARRHLPDELYAKVKRSVREGSGRLPAGIVGAVPPADASPRRADAATTANRGSGQRKLSKVGA